MAPKVAEKAVKQPAKKAPAAKKVVKKTAGGSKKKTKAVESYKIYIYKVLKQVKPSYSCCSSMKLNWCQYPKKDQNQTFPACE